MIFDKIENWERYLGISGNLDKAFKRSEERRVGKECRG